MACLQSSINFYVLVKTQFILLFLKATPGVWSFTTSSHTARIPYRIAGSGFPLTHLEGNDGGSGAEGVFSTV